MSEPTELPSSEETTEGNSEAFESPESQMTRILMHELIRLRKRKKIAQEPLAKAIGISQSRLSQIENFKCGSMTLDTFLLYAQTIGAEIVVQAPKKKGTTKPAASNFERIETLEGGKSVDGI